MRGRVRELTHQINSISEEQVSASAAINGARTSGHAAAHTQYQQESAKVTKLEQDADAARKLADQTAQDAAVAKKDLATKTELAQNAQRALKQSQITQQDGQTKLNQAQQELARAKDVLAELTRASNIAGGTSDALIQAQKNVTSAQNVLDDRLRNLTRASDALRAAQSAKSSAQSEVNHAQSQIDRLTSAASHMSGPTDFNQLMAYGNKAHRSELEGLAKSINLKKGSSVNTTSFNGGGSLDASLMQVYAIASLASRAVGTEEGLRRAWEQVTSNPALLKDLPADKARRVFDIFSNMRGAVDNANNIRQARNTLSQASSRVQTATQNINQAQSNESNARNQIETARNTLRISRLEMSEAERNHRERGQDALNGARAALKTLESKVGELSHINQSNNDRVTSAQRVLNERQNDTSRATETVSRLEQARNRQIEQASSLSRDAGAAKVALNNTVVDAPVSSPRPSTLRRAQSFAGEFEQIKEEFEAIQQNAQATYAAAVKEAKQADRDTKSAQAAKQKLEQIRPVDTMLSTATATPLDTQRKAVPPTPPMKTHALTNHRPDGIPQAALNVLDVSDTSLTTSDMRAMHGQSEVFFEQLRDVAQAIDAMHAEPLHLPSKAMKV